MKLFIKPDIVQLPFKVLFIDQEAFIKVILALFKVLVVELFQFMTVSVFIIQVVIIEKVEQP